MAEQQVKCQGGGGSAAKWIGIAIAAIATPVSFLVGWGALLARVDAIDARLVEITGDLKEQSRYVMDHENRISRIEGAVLGKSAVSPGGAK